MAGITKKQIAKVWATAKEISLEDDLLYCAVLRISGNTSMSELTKVQGAELIDYLIAQKTSKTIRPGMATEKQLWLINKLAEELGWADDPTRLQKFIRKYAKVDSPKWITVKMASNIIQALKAMVQRLPVETKVHKEASEAK